MRFLVDQQLPPALAQWFRSRGHQADHTQYIGLGAAPDADIWAFAQEISAVIVTKDSDFAAMRRRTAGPQILWLRIGNASRSEVLAHVEALWPDVLAFLEQGEPIVAA